MNYSSAASASITNSLLLMMSFYLMVIFVVIFLYRLTTFCLKSIGLYKMAKRRNFNNAYLAWIPFASFYLFGKISDDINSHKNIRSSNRFVLLVLSILRFVFVSAFLAVIVAGFAVGCSNGNSSDALTGFLSQNAHWLYILLFAFCIVSFILAIFYCIYANNILKDYAPKISSILCTVIILSLFILSDPLADSVVFLSISANEPMSLKADS